MKRGGGGEGDGAGGDNGVDVVDRGGMFELLR